MNRFLPAFALILLINSAAGHQLFAQEYLIRFIKSEHDFGTVNEQNGPVSYEFRFYNAGEKPLQIKNVQASCGCTTPEWTQEELMPGDSGSVVAEFDPEGRPGNFEKHLTVVSNSHENITVLTIKGKVVNELVPGLSLPVSFEQHFNYDKRKIDKGSEAFKAFREQLLKLAAVKDTLDVFIEGSASLVPTNEYASNKALAEARKMEAREVLQSIIEENGLNNHIYWQTKALAQGPHYKNDAQENIAYYERFQYVKIFVE